jgi:hypothetical protein
LSSQTALITFGSHFSSQHNFKVDSLSEAERLENYLYQSGNNHLSMAFAPLACNSFGRQAPDFLQYQWVVADKAAQRMADTPLFLSRPRPWSLGFLMTLLLKSRHSNGFVGTFSANLPRKF